MIETPNGSNALKGVCKYCQVERQFKPFIEDGARDWMSIKARDKEEGR